MSCQSNDFQRTCFCQSQFLDSMIGCLECYLLHGGADSSVLTSIDLHAVEPAMDEYCDPMVEPTTNFGVYLSSIFTTQVYTSTLTTWSDPLGSSKTDVSVYYTPSMTGVEAWATTLSTIADWSGDSVETSESAISTPRTSTNDYTSSDTLTLNSRKSLASTKTVDSLSTSAIAPTAYPPIFVQPVYPTTTTKMVPLPLLVTDDSASHTVRASVGAILGISSLVVMLLIL
jgi:hypothetical protein